MRDRLSKRLDRDTRDAPVSPERFADEAALEELMITPADTLRAALARVDGDIIVLGVGGKMGPTLAGLAKRAASDKRVVGVARFTDPRVRDKLAAWGVETIQCDLATVTRSPLCPGSPMWCSWRGASSAPSATTM